MIQIDRCPRAGRCLTALALLGLSLLLLQGCAAIALTLFGAAAGTAGGAGVGHTLDSITYKTFTVPLAALFTATILTLDRMDIPVMADRQTGPGRTILAQAGDREVEIELDRLTANTTRMRVVAMKNWFVRDRATATEIILQTDRTLSDNPHLAVAAPRPTPAPRPNGTARRTTQRCAKGVASC